MLASMTACSDGGVSNETENVVTEESNTDVTSTTAPTKEDESDAPELSDKMLDKLKNYTLTEEQFQPKTIDLTTTGESGEVMPMVTINQYAGEDTVYTDWSVYASDYVYSMLSPAEKTFFDRMDEVALTYMNTEIDATLSGEDYLLNPVYYGDLGITKERASKLIH